MGPLEMVAGRLRRPDALQTLALFLAGLVFVLAIRWPGDGAPNASWFLMAQARAAMLVLAGLGFGAAAADAAVPDRRATAAMLLLFVALSAAFDAATYAATMPEVPFVYAALLPVPQVLAAFGAGLLLGWLTGRLRLRGLLPVLIPALPLVAAYADVRLERVVFNPVLAAVRVAPWHLAAVVFVAAITVAWLSRPAAPPPNDGGAS